MEARFQVFQLQKNTQKFGKKTAKIFLRLFQFFFVFLINMDSFFSSGPIHLSPTPQALGNCRPSWSCCQGDGEVGLETFLTPLPTLSRGNSLLIHA